jgi:hypothetical protein
MRVDVTSSAMFRPIRCFVRPSTFERTLGVRLPPSERPRFAQHPSKQSSGSWNNWPRSKWIALGRFRRGRGMNDRCAPGGQVVGHSHDSPFSTRFRQQYLPKPAKSGVLTCIRTHPFCNLFAVDFRIPQMPKRTHFADSGTTASPVTISYKAQYLSHKRTQLGLLVSAVDTPLPYAQSERRTDPSTFLQFTSNTATTGWWSDG